MSKDSSMMSSSDGVDQLPGYGIFNQIAAQLADEDFALKAKTPHPCSHTVQPDLSCLARPCMGPELSKAAKRRFRYRRQFMETQPCPSSSDPSLRVALEPVQMAARIEEMCKRLERIELLLFMAPEADFQRLDRLIAKVLQTPASDDEPEVEKSPTKADADVEVEQPPRRTSVAECVQYRLDEGDTEDECQSLCRSQIDLEIQFAALDGDVHQEGARAEVFDCSTCIKHSSLSSGGDDLAEQAPIANVRYEGSSGADACDGKVVEVCRATLIKANSPGKTKAIKNIIVNHRIHNYLYGFVNGSLHAAPVAIWERIAPLLSLVMRHLGPIHKMKLVREPDLAEILASHLLIVNKNKKAAKKFASSL
eukprot:TRINITY_DN7213_c0_g1_i1.p1 TRINITY_DN7213_c0_g1~~TRINITY_DN7213_c0_g1_i1.p1  ORF type:complete len:365 (-),score=70.69 TRINITY_DN7213_c0_g1_i1:754-1848(-)